MSVATEHENAPRLMNVNLDFVLCGSLMLFHIFSVDRIVETAMAASEVREVVIQLMKDVERQERAEVKRRAAEQESRQSEEDYCEEDREALRKCREDRRDEDRNARRGSPEEPKEATKGGNKPESGSLDDLKDKIRLLQVQLKVQHVQALQSMNSEVVLLQGQIMKELQALPFVTSMESLFTASSKKPAKGSAQGSTLAKEASRGGGGDGAGAGAGTGEERDYKTSLLTLVADLVDSACHALRNDLLDVHTNTSISTNNITPVDSTTDDNAAAASVLAEKKAATTPQGLLDQHLGWMRIVLADGSAFSKAQLNAVVSALAAQAAGDAESTVDIDGTIPSAADGASSAPSNSAPTCEAEVSMRLALLPDYRAKTLYLASLVDLTAVQDIIGPQLLQRLEEILLEGKECISRSNIPPVPVPVSVSDSEDLNVEVSSDESKGGDDVPVAAGDDIGKSTAEVNLNDIDDDDCDIDMNIDMNIKMAVEQDLCGIDVDFAEIDLEIAQEEQEVEEESEAAAHASGAHTAYVVPPENDLPSLPTADAACMPPPPPPLAHSDAFSASAKDVHRCSDSVASTANIHKTTLSSTADIGGCSPLKASRPPPTALEGENLKPNVSHAFTA